MPQESRPELPSPADDEPAGTARVSASLAIRVHPTAVCRALADPGWLGRLVDRPEDPAGYRRVETDLVFAVPSEARVLTFRKAAYVDVGPVGRGRGACVVEIGWRASTLAPLFPVFAGRLEVGEGVLRLDGVYAPPGGGIGVLVDRAVLHFVAKRTAVWFLERLAAHASSAQPRPRDGH